MPPPGEPDQFMHDSHLPHNEPPGGTRPGFRRGEDSFDAAIAAALRALPVPTGLAERIQAALAAPVSPPVMAAEIATRLNGKPEPALVPADLPSKSVAPLAGAVLAESIAPGRPWRRWLAGSVVATGACAAAALIWICWLQPTPLACDAEEVMRQVRELHAVQSDESPWNLASEAAPPAAFPPPPLAALRHMARWRWMDDEFLGRPCVAYESMTSNGIRLTVYVTALHGRRQSPELVHLGDHPLADVLFTGGTTSSAWTDGTHLFVLVVEGGPDELERIVNPGGALARAGIAPRRRSLSLSA